jgi:zinc protease
LVLRLTRALTLVLALIVLVPEGRAAPAGVAPSYFKLGNGLEIVVIPDHRTPVITHMVWYKVGAADEQPGKSGLAHFLEHLMFKGTAKFPTGRFSGTVAGIGGQENAFTANDYTGYFQRVSKDHLPQLMALEADRMTGLILTDEVVLPELQVVLEEQNQRVANDPSALLGEQVAAALYVNHPYGKPAIGWRHEIEKLTREDALAFYRRWYTPNNAVLVVAGDVTPDEVKRLAEDTYGKVEPRADIGPRIRPQEPEPIAVRQVTFADPRVGQPSLQRSYLVPSDTTAKPGEAEALDVLTHILANGSVSRLYRKLVVEKGIAASVGGWYQSSALDPTRVALYVTPRPGVELPAAEAALDDALAEVIARGVTAEEISRAKERMIADMTYAQDSQTSLARIYGVALTIGSSVERVRDWPDRIRAVTPEAIQAVARRYLDKRRSVTGYLMRDESGPPGEARRVQQQGPGTGELH